MNAEPASRQTPAEAYLAAARARNIAHGYDRTLTRDHFDRIVADAARQPALRAEVDAVWNLAHPTPTPRCIPTMSGLTLPSINASNVTVHVPCALPAGHDGDYHAFESGRRWRFTEDGAVVTTTDHGEHLDPAPPTLILDATWPTR